jgi:hypothetical protein
VTAIVASLDSLMFIVSERPRTFVGSQSIPRANGHPLAPNSTPAACQSSLRFSGLSVCSPTHVRSRFERDALLLQCVEQPHSQYDDKTATHYALRLWDATRIGLQLVGFDPISAIAQCNCAGGGAEK